MTRLMADTFKNHKHRLALPILVHDFSHAYIDDIAIGPRREVTLKVTVLVRNGTTFHMVEGINVRFGGIENFAEASSFLATQPHHLSELAWLRYATGERSKPGCLYFDLVFERIDAKLVIKCSSLQVSGPGTQEDASEIAPNLPLR
jgi:hypothetical protein